MGLTGPGHASFAFSDDQRQLAYAWHAHSRHQLLVALSGAVRLEVSGASYVLPPQRAGFIPAGVRHATSMSEARLCSVYLDPALVPAAPKEVRVVAAGPLLREMVVYAARFTPARRGERTAEAFFRCLGLMCEEWLAEPVRARMPRGRSREVRSAIDYLREHLVDATLETAAKRAGSSTRTLRRRIAEELGTSFRELTTHARLVRAMELLSEPQQRVTAVALEVGYTSMSAFAKSFARFAGETPSSYRARSTSARAGRRS
jgi:AraC-like DNA-binding protein